MTAAQSMGTGARLTLIGASQLILLQVPVLQPEGLNILANDARTTASTSDKGGTGELASVLIADCGNAFQRLMMISEGRTPRRQSTVPWIMRMQLAPDG